MKIARIGRTIKKDDGPSYGTQGLFWIEVASQELDSVQASSSRRIVQWQPEQSVASDSYIAVVLEREIDIVLNSFRFLASELPIDEPGFTVLVERRKPPSEVRRFDESICSFFCTSAFWQRVNPMLPLNSAELWCYGCLSFLMSATAIGSSLYVRQLPMLRAQSEFDTSGPHHVSLIIPHRGSEAYLRTAVSRSLALRHKGRLELLVGLDVDEAEPYSDLVKLAELRLFRGLPAPVGPYVLRQAMIEACNADLFMFQDSDDVPCTDRLEVLLGAMHALQVDMVGCHEVEVNEIDQEVRIYRFPLSVSEVLGRQDVEGVSHNSLEPLLHATTLVNRATFLSAGGLSTNRRIANDSQFLLRAHFSMKIANVDEFLYLRRVHRRALTVADETRNGNELRKSLSQQWGSDFKLVKAGKLELEKSSLFPTRHGPGVRVVEWPSLRD